MAICTGCKYYDACGDEERVIVCDGFEKETFPSAYEGYSDFVQDECKMHDFITMSMEDFLSFYSYLEEADYYATYDRLMKMIGDVLGWEYTIDEDEGGDEYDS